MADQDVLFKILAAVGEASLLFGAVVDVARPAVRLHADGYVDLGHFQGTAYIAESIIVSRLMLSVRCRIFRCDRDRARVDAAIVRSVVSICIGEVNRRQGFPCRQTFHLNLTSDFGGQFEFRTVVLLLKAICRDRNLFLIEKGEGQSTFRDGICDLVVRTGVFSVVSDTFHRLI